MKKSELMKIIKEELQKQMNLKEYDGGRGEKSKAHEFNDRTTVDTLRKILTVLQSIDAKTGAPAPTNMSGGE